MSACSPPTASAGRRRRGGVREHDVGGTWFDNTYPGCRSTSPTTSTATVRPHDVAAALLRPGHPARLLPGGSPPTPACATTCASAPRCSAPPGPTRRRPGRSRCGLPGAPGTGRGPRPCGSTPSSARSASSTPPARDPGHRRTSPGRGSTPARWDHSVDLTGKRVAVIGTGASAAQFIPPWPSRPPTWSCSSARPTGWPRRPTTTRTSSPRSPGSRPPARVRRLVPALALLAHARGPHPARRRSIPSGPAHRVGQPPQRDGVPGLVEYLDEQFAGHPDPAGEGRPDLPADRQAHRARQRRLGPDLTADHVHLVTDAIEAVAPTGVRRGVDHDVDVIIYGTGFTRPVPVTPDAAHRAGRRRAAPALGRRRPPPPASPCPTSRTCSCSTGRTRTS